MAWFLCFTAKTWYYLVQVICNPDTNDIWLGDEDAYLILASDGLTEQWSIEEAALAVSDAAKGDPGPAKVAEILGNRWDPLPLR